MEIDPVPEGLNGRDDAGHKRTPGHNLEIARPTPPVAWHDIFYQLFDNQ
jgi:hypothetical protein